MIPDNIHPYGLLSCSRQSDIRRLFYQEMCRVSPFGWETELIVANIKSKDGWPIHLPLPAILTRHKTGCPIHRGPGVPGERICLCSLGWLAMSGTFALRANPFSFSLRTTTVVAARR